MLKIKDDVNLKELEKFGFKPKYDEYTGEIKELNKVVYLRGRLIITKKNPITIMTILKKPPEKEMWIISNYPNPIGNDLETLYDLIQANLAEKVEE